MRLDPDTCYEMLLSRDRRFDGWFFVAVSSTGVYCRPVCPVRPPKQQNCHFFPSAATAEKAGFRPCMRCRPELAPGNGLLDISRRLATATAGLIEEGFLNAGTVEQLAKKVGVTERHLRRIFSIEFGVSIIDFAQTQRLLLAKRLLTDTALPVSNIASAAGFGSVRRLNDLFLKRYGFSPLRLRKGIAPDADEMMTFELTYRPPFSWSAILDFLAHRCIDPLERINDHTYARIVELPHRDSSVIGWISAKHVPQRCAVKVSVTPTLAPVIAQLLARVRRLFDLACQPDQINNHLGDLASGLPGMRVPGAFDGFEAAVSAIVGQHKSADRARAILANIATRFGTVIKDPPLFGLSTTFPSASVLARVHSTALEQTGIERMHAEAIIAMAALIADGKIALEPMAPLEDTLAALRGINGISEWTVQYIAMRAMAWPNAFPEDDAVLMKHFGHASATALRSHASQWEPWRAYATLHVWRQHHEQPL
jgi:AraC family transcriptional regulator of adaptative response / DNA-3-methyladenine glycosylase II